MLNILTENMPLNVPQNVLKNYGKKYLYAFPFIDYTHNNLKKLKIHKRHYLF